MTTLGPDIAQVDYRLQESAGCSHTAQSDAQADYRLDDAAAPLRWIGEGLREFGIEPGEVFGQGDKDAARLLMSGQNPLNKDQLVVPKRAVDPRAKLPAVALVEVVNRAAAERGTTVGEWLVDQPRLVERFARLERGVARQGERHRAPVRDLEKIARATGVDLSEVYEPEVLAVAREYAGARVRVGNRGYDVNLDVAKSYSVLHGLAGPELARGLEDAYHQAVAETVSAMEAWAGYGQRGHQGDGRLADRVDGTGLLGWSMTHHTARPVDGHAPDPHLHAHVSIANMVRGVDGQWSAIGAGGRDIHRHAHAADALLKARLRAITTERFGLSWERSASTGAWEVVGIDEDTRALFSKRAGQVRDALDEAGLDPAAVTTGRSKTMAQQSAEGKQPNRTVADLRADWRSQAERAGLDVDRLVAAAAPGPQTIDAALADIDATVVAEQIFNPHDGLTAHRKSFTRADLLAAVADAAPDGLVDQAALEELTDRVLAVGSVERLGRDAGGPHLSNADRYTTRDLIDAEVAVLTAAGDRLDGGFAAVTKARAAAGIEAFEATAGFELSGEQRAVVTRLATSGNGIEAVIGAAGTGKTTIMEALAVIHETAGHRIAGASTAAVAAHHLQAETGIPSTTIAAWLHRIDRGDGLDGVDVLVVDEAGMVDDRQAARLVAAAAATGTQIVGIGDPQQLRSPGVGSVFGDVHGIVGGLELADNRRQQEETHRKALAAWRDGGRRAALDALADAGCIHVEDSIDGTHAAMIGAWDATRHDWPDPHDQIAAHLMLAGTNRDVDALNDAAQAVRVDAGELDPATGREYRSPDGGRTMLHPGDVVILRINDRDRDRPGPAVLNGYRGIITDLDTATGDVTVQWREPGRRRLWEQTLDRGYIEQGGVRLGYAMTVHLAQGQTAHTVAANLTGLDPNAAYPALSRHRHQLDAWLTRDVLEDDETRARLGEPVDDTDKLARALDAYATYLERPDPEELVIAELGARHAHLLAHREPAIDTPSRSGDSVESPAALAWWEREHGALTDAELTQKRHALADEITRRERAMKSWRARQDYRAERAEQRLADAEAGRGDHAQALTRRRDLLSTAVDEARAAASEHDAARTIQTQITGMAAQQRALQNQARTNPVWLRLRGTSRDQLHQQVADLGTELNRLIGDRDLRHRSAWLHTAAADDAARAAETSRSQAPETLDRLNADWDHQYGEAIATDRAAAAAIPLAQAVHPDPRPADPQTARRDLDAIAAEAALRAEQSPTDADRERRDRAIARAEAADRLTRDNQHEPVDRREAAATTVERAISDEQSTPRRPRPGRPRDTEPPPHRRPHPGPDIDRGGPGLSR